MEYNNYEADGAADDEEEIRNEDDDYDQNGNIIMYKALNRLHKRFITYCKQLPVLGFNSSRYDLNLVMKQLSKALNPFEEKTSS